MHQTYITSASSHFSGQNICRQSFPASPRVNIYRCYRAISRSHIVLFREVKDDRHDGVLRSTRVCSAAHPFRPLSIPATCIIRVRAPLDIETDIPFCPSILPGGGGGGIRVREPLSPRPPLFLRHLHHHLLGRLCRLRVRRGAVCSSFPSVYRPPSVENHVFPVACYVASRGVAVARLFVPLADNRAITRWRDNRRQLRKITRARRVSERFSQGCRERHAWDLVEFDARLAHVRRGTDVNRNKVEKAIIQFFFSFSV